MRDAAQPASAKTRLAARPDVDARALLEAELLDLAARHLRPEVRPVRRDELDAHLEAEVDDALDVASRVVPFAVERDLDVVRPDERVAEAVDRADEAHHELVRRVLVEVARPADLLDPALVHHRDPVGDLHRLLLVVRDDHGRRVRLVVESAQPDAQVLADARVERAERLVEQQHLRLDRERAGERHPLALAAGELGRIAVGEALELDERDQLVDARARSPSSAACGSSARRRRCRARSCA